LTSPCDGQVNFDKVVPPETSRPVTFEDYLVQQAWTNSQEKEKNRTEMAIAKKEVEIARKEWMDQVQMGFNLNEISLGNAFDSGENPTDNIVVYPLYTFNASISLGTLYNNKKKREIKEFEVKLQELDERQQKLYLRREVLSRYQILLLAEKVLDTRILAEEDSKNTRDISAERFKTGEIKLEDMTKASESYYQALENRMTAETDLEIAKIDLEQLLGIQWSFAVKMRQRIKNR
jgi:outer membrane protein TolC